MKRGSELSINTIIILVLAVIAAAVLLYFFSDSVSGVFKSMGRIGGVANSSSIDVAQDATGLIDSMRTGGT